MFSARRGFFFRPWERRALLAHCFATWAYAWASPADPGRQLQEKGIVYTSWAHSSALEQAALGVFTVSLVVLLFVLGRGFLLERRRPPLGPLTVFVVTLWLWTIYSSIDPLLLYVIPALHSIQYLYVVWLLRRNRAKATEGPPTFGKPVAVQVGSLAVGAVALAWLLFHGAPDLFDGAFGAPHRDPGELGYTPFFASIFVFVNIHHYFMDYVIWRRENPEMGYLRGP